MKQLAATIMLALSVVPACAHTPPVPPEGAAARPAHWAEPIALEGVNNLHRISPMLYRSEQPTAQGMKNLEQLGIRTVINLRFFGDDRQEAAGTQLRTERVKILTWNIDDDHVVAVMKLLKQPGNGPFLIHCQHGADRTGLMSAMYRILEQGWTADDALAELTGGGYGYHSIWTNILEYIREADIDSLRTQIAQTQD